MTPYQLRKKEIVSRLASKATPAELILRRALLANKIPFTFQKPLTIKQLKYRRTHFYVADFFLPQHATVIEIDGAYHKHQLNKDKFRTREMLASMKMVRFVIRFFNYEIHNELNKVIETILSLKPVRFIQTTKRARQAARLHNQEIMRQNEIQYLVNMDNEASWYEKQRMIKAADPQPVQPKRPNVILRKKIKLNA